MIFFKVGSAYKKIHHNGWKDCGDDFWTNGLGDFRGHEKCIFQHFRKPFGKKCIFTTQCYLDDDVNRNLSLTIFDFFLIKHFINFTLGT